VTHLPSDLEQAACTIEQRLQDTFKQSSLAPRLWEAMEYAVMGGGKRIRPQLVLASAALNGRGLLQEAALDAAVAIELFHTYSLVHDDLPAMDNDDFRRGRPTVHKVFDEATAILVGDALQTLAFETILQSQHIGHEQKVDILTVMTQAGGAEGMAGGQAIDLEHVGQAMGLTELEQMHRMKTGALLRASAVMGGIAGGLGRAQIDALDRYASHLGLAFQVVDDVLDATMDSATLGKTAGKDALAEKPTYVSLLDLDKARAFARKLHLAAIAEIKDEDHASFLLAIADRVVERSN